MVTNGCLHTLEAQTGNTGFTWKALEGMKGPYREKNNKRSRRTEDEEGKREWNGERGDESALKQKEEYLYSN